MCQALRELMKDEIQKDIDEATANARADGIRTAVDIYRTDLGLDDQAIIGKIIARFGLTNDQAKSYVMPHAG